VKIATDYYQHYSKEINTKTKP